MKVKFIQYIINEKLITGIIYENVLYTKFMTLSSIILNKIEPYKYIIITKKEFELINSEDQIVKNIIFDILESKYKI